MLSRAAILVYLIVIGACVPFSIAARTPALAELQSEPAPVDNVPPQNLIRKCSTYKDCKGITCDAVDSVIWHVECVNGSCHCIPNAAAPVELQYEPAPVDDVPAPVELQYEPAPVDDVPAPVELQYEPAPVDDVPAPVELLYEPAPVDDVPSSPKTCSTVKDCKSVPCNIVSIDSVIWRVDCVNGICQCVPHETSEAPELPELQSEPAPVDEVRRGLEKCVTVKDCKHILCLQEAGTHLECIKGTCQCVKGVPPQTDEPTASPLL